MGQPQRVVAELAQPSRSDCIHSVFLLHKHCLGSPREGTWEVARPCEQWESWPVPLPLGTSTIIFLQQLSS